MVEKNKGFQVFAHILMIFLTLCCLAPFILLFMSSFTSEDALIANGYSFFPAEFSAEAYRYILTDSASILSAYGLSFLVTIVGTICNLTIDHPVRLSPLPKRASRPPGVRVLPVLHHAVLRRSGAIVYHVDQDVPHFQYHLCPADPQPFDGRL